MNWFREYVCILDCHKVQSLPDKLFRWYHAFKCVACEYGQGGLLPPVSQLAFRMRRSVAAVQEACEALSMLRLLDKTQDGFSVHDWGDWQYDSDNVNERVKRFRKRNHPPNGNVACNVSGNVAVKLHETPQNRSEQIRAEQSRTGSNGRAHYDPQPLWEFVLGLYPKHRLNPHMDLQVLIGVADPIIDARIRADLPRRVSSDDWRREGGKFVPKLSKYLGERLFDVPLEPESSGDPGDLPEFA